MASNNKPYIDPLGNTFEYDEGSGQYKMVEQKTTFSTRGSSSSGSKEFTLGATDPRQGNTYTIRTKNKSYTIGQSALDWIRKAYRQSFNSHYAYDDEDQWNKANGIMPRSYANKYSNNTWDQQLLELGLPSSNFLGEYLEAYHAWYGDGQYFAPAKEASDYIKTQWQKSWEYSNDPEDLKRKAAGQMPLSEEKKYKDKDGNSLSYADEMYLSMGLPSSSELASYGFLYNDYVTKQNRVNEFYTEFANRAINELSLKGIKNDDTLYTQDDGTQVTGRTLWSNLYDSIILEDSWSDVRSWEQMPARSVDGTTKTIEIDPSWDADDIARAERAAQQQAANTLKEDEDPYAINPTFDACVSFFDDAAKDVYTQQLADEAVGMVFGTVGDTVDAAYASNVDAMYASLTSEEAILNYIDTRPDDYDPAQIILDLRQHGVSNKQTRQARNILLDRTSDPEVKKAIKAAFNTPRVVRVTDEDVDGGVLDDFRDKYLTARDTPITEADDFGEQLKEDYEISQETELDRNKMYTLFESSLEFGEDGIVSSDSVAAAVNALAQQGASSRFIKDVAAGVVNANALILGDGIQQQGTSSLMAVVEQAAADADVANRRKIAEQHRAAASEHMTDFEFDQMLRRMGWSDVLTDEQAARNYFVESNYQYFVPQELLASMPVEQQKEYAARIWDSETDEWRQERVSEFSLTKDVNAEIDKNAGEVAMDYVGGRWLQNLALGLASGAVGFADMASGALTGSTREQWEITDTLSKAYQWSANYGKSDQSAGMQALNFGTTVANELMRMSALGGISKTALFNKGIAGIVSGSLTKTTPFIANAMGSYFGEAMSSGADRRNATVYALVSGTIEGALETLAMDTWASKALGSKKLAKTVMDGKTAFTRASLGKKAVGIHLAASALGEFGEESTSYFCSYIMQRLTYGKQEGQTVESVLGDVDWGAMLESGLMGAAIGFTGAAFNSGSYNASNIIATYMQDNKYDSNFFDLLHAAVQVESLPKAQYEQLSENGVILSYDDYKVAQGEIAKHAKYLEDNRTKHAAAVEKINAEVQIKVDAVSALQEQIAALSGDITAANAKELGKLMESLRVAESELAVERAQAENKLAEENTSFANMQAQYRDTIAKHQSKVDGHNVALYNEFLPDIAAMRGVSVASIQRARAEQEINDTSNRFMAAYRSDQFYEGLFDDIDSASEQMATAQSRLTDADNTLADIGDVQSRIYDKMKTIKGGARKAFQQGDSEQRTTTEQPQQSRADQPVVPRQQTERRAEQPEPRTIENDIATAVTQVNNAAAWEQTLSEYNPRYMFRDGINDWYYEAETGKAPVAVLTDRDGNSYLIPSDADKNLANRSELPEAYDINGTRSGNGYRINKLARVEPYGNYFRIVERGEIELLNAEQIAQQSQIEQADEQVVAQTQPAQEQSSPEVSQYVILDDDAITRITELGNKLGRSVVVEDLPDGVNGRYDGDGVLHINRKQLAKAGGHPELIVFKHELTHSLESSKRYYDRLVDFVEQYAKDSFKASERFSTFEDQYNAFAEDVRRTRAALGQETTDEIIKHEFVAAFAQDHLFTDEVAVNALVKANASLGSRILNQIRYWLYKNGIGGTGDKAADDLKQIERLYAMALHNAGVKPSDDVREYMARNSGIKLSKSAIDRLPRELYSYLQDTIGEAETSVHVQKIQRISADARGGTLNWIYEFENGVLVFDKDGTYKYEPFYNGAKYGAYKANRNRNVYYGHHGLGGINSFGSQGVNVDPRTLQSSGKDTTDPRSGHQTVRRAADAQGDDGNAERADSQRQKVSRELSTGASWDDYFASDVDAAEFSSGLSWDDAGSQYGVHEQGMNPRARNIDVPVSSDGTDRTSLFLRTALESSNVSDETLQDVVTTFEREQFGTYNPQSNSVLLDKARNYITKTGGITKALESFHNDAKAGKHSSLNTAIGMQLLAEMKDDPAASLDIIADLCIMATESGRSTQSFAMLKKLGGVGSAYYMKRLESRFNEKYKKQIANGDMDGFRIPDDLMQNLIDAKSAYEIEAAEEAVAKYLGEAMPLSFAERMQNWRYFAMLSNPATHFRNILGNSLMMVANAGKNVVATGIERAFVAKDKRTHAIYNPANQRERIAAAEQSFRDNHKDITASGGKYGFDQEVTKHKRFAKSKVLNSLMEFNAKALEVEDNFFLHSGYVNAYTQFLVARDIDPANMTRQQKADAHAWATKQAQEITFRDASVIADTLNSIANKGVVAKVLVEGAIPFKKTPVNIAARAIEYSPAGLAKTIYKATAGVKNGTSTTADAIDHLSRNITGTGVLALGYFLAKLGVLRGNGDDDEEVETFKLATGDKNYSFTFGDKVIEASGIAPMNIPMFMGAALYEVTEGSGVDFTLSDLSALLTEITNPLMEMSFLSSLNSVLSSYSSDGVGGNLGNMAWQATKNYASQYIPAPVAKTADVIDRVERSTAGDPTTALGKSESKYERSLRAKIPFLSQTLEPKIDIHGDKNVRYGFGELAMEVANAYILPAKVTTKNRNAVDESLLSLYRTTGRTDIFPVVPKNNKFTHNHKPYQMNAKQFTQYSIDLGNETYAAIKSVMSSPSWSKLDDAAKADIIADTIGNTKEAMRVKYLDILGAYDK